MRTRIIRSCRRLYPVASSGSGSSFLTLLTARLTGQSQHTVRSGPSSEGSRSSVRPARSASPPLPKSPTRLWIGAVCRFTPVVMMEKVRKTSPLPAPPFRTVCQALLVGRTVGRCEGLLRLPARQRLSFVKCASGHKTAPPCKPLGTSARWRLLRPGVNWPPGILWITFEPVRQHSSAQQASASCSGLARYLAASSPCGISARSLQEAHNSRSGRIYEQAIGTGGWATSSFALQHSDCKCADSAGAAKNSGRVEYGFRAHRRGFTSETRVPTGRMFPGLGDPLEGPPPRRRLG
jgi:hypothetical protein